MKRLQTRWLIGLALLTIALGCAGCVGIQSDPDSVLPANAPAHWEGKTLGVPM